MVADTLKEANLLLDAVEQLKAHVETLLEDVVIELPEDHFPARRAASLYDPVGTSSGDKITFQIYRRALKDIEDGTDRILGINLDFVGDEENNSFSAAVSKLRDSGMSLVDAIGAQSGALNLDTLAEGMIPGFLELIKNILPDMPGLDSLGAAAGPLSDYMTTGMPNTQHASLALIYAAKDAVEKVKNIAKASVGIQTAAMKEEDAAPAKLVKYAVSYALNKSSEYSPAKIWAAWAIYPELRQLHSETKALIAEGISDSTGAIKFTQDGTVVTTVALLNKRLAFIRETVRSYAVLLSSCISRTELCCLAGYFSVSGKQQLDRFRAILKIGPKLEQIRGLETPDYTKYFDMAKNKIVGNLVRVFDSLYARLVEELRTQWDKLAADINCAPLGILFDLILSVLRELRRRVINMMRKFAASVDIERRQTRTKTLSLMRNVRVAGTLEILDRVEAELNFAHRCKLDENTAGARIFKITESFGCSSVSFMNHRRGQPKPVNVDPNHPLLDLDPENLGSFTLEPGIQGEEIPTGDFEKLFESCRTRRLDRVDGTQVARTEVRRR